jgi:hypothetical protein
MEFSRTRVFDKSDVGDEDNDASSEAFLLDLYLCCLTFIGRSSGTPDMELSGPWGVPRTMDEGEAVNVTSRVSRAVEASVRDSGVTARIVLLLKPSRNTGALLAGDVDCLLDRRSIDCICDRGRPEWRLCRSEKSESIAMLAHALATANQNACAILNASLEQPPCCNFDTQSAIDWTPLTDLFLIDSIESRKFPRI